MIGSVSKNLDHANTSGDRQITKIENSEELNILADEFIRKIYQFKTGINN